MVERFLSQTSFTSQEDFIKNLKINVPENFNFGYDVVDAWAAEQPDKPALLWTNDQGECRQFTFADMKRYTDMTASYFQSLGIGRGDMVMLILKMGSIISVDFEQVFLMNNAMVKKQLEVFEVYIYNNSIASGSTQIGRAHV